MLCARLRYLLSSAVWLRDGAERLLAVVIARAIRLVLLFEEATLAARVEHGVDGIVRAHGSGAASHGLRGDGRCRAIDARADGLSVQAVALLGCG